MTRECVEAVVPVDSLVQHETVQPERLDALLDDVRVRGILVPIHVTPAGQDWMVVDGAHRAASARALGWREVRVHIVDIPRSARVAGWTHVVSPEAAGRLAARAEAVPARDRGVLAHGRRGGVPFEILGDPTDVAELHRVAGLYRDEPYLRVAWPDDAAADRITWLPPRWGELTRTVRAQGPLPAGVTRLGAYLDDGCAAQARRREEAVR